MRKSIFHRNFHSLICGRLLSAAVCVCISFSVVSASAAFADTNILNIGSRAEEYLERLCEDTPNRVSSSSGQDAAGRYIRNSLTDTGCTVYLVSKAELNGNYVQAKLVTDDSEHVDVSTEESTLAEAPTGNVYINGVPYIYMGGSSEDSSEANEEPAATTSVKTSAEEYVNPITGDNYIAHFDGESDRTVFLYCYYDTAESCEADTTPTDSGTSAVAFLLAFAEILAENDDLYYNVDLGFFDNSAKARAGEFEFFDNLTDEYSAKIDSIIELDELIGDEICVYNAASTDMSAQASQELLAASFRVGVGLLSLDNVVPSESLTEACASPISLIGLPAIKVSASRWLDTDQKHESYSTYGSYLYQTADSHISDTEGQISGTSHEYYGHYIEELQSLYTASCNKMAAALYAYLQGGGR